MEMLIKIRIKNIVHKYCAKLLASNYFITFPHLKTL